MFLVVEMNTEHNAIFNSSFSTVSDVVTSQFSKTKEHFYMASVADSLARQNSLLLQERDNAKFLQTVFKDSIQEEEKDQMYTFTAAKVISKTINLNNNGLTINRGTSHGIKPSMGIIGAGNNSVIGIVKSCTKNFSRVLPILHSQSRISSTVKRSNYPGSLVWKGGDPTRANLVDVPKHADVIKGDTIQTSGYSTIFPEGIMIGTVDTFWLQQGTNFYEIEINLSNDLSRTKYVYVVENLMKAELEELEKEVSDE